MSDAKLLATAICEYLGGHPDIAQRTIGNIYVNKKGIFFDVPLSTGYIHIPIQNIIKSEFKNEEQISKDVTLTRLLAFGIFAFGLKKKRKEVLTYLVVAYNEDGIENTIIFESKNASAVASAIIKARQLYAKENPQAQVSDSAADGSTAQVIPEQIKKLAELKEQGILTQEEFENKKADLLSRM
ncbi:MAG TPA: SHOCT domain-containing protein [Clostridiaceae bacterium]|nr:SHOCT domain-containing protein [Clostridiaceae bacterium]